MPSLTSWLGRGSTWWCNQGHCLYSLVTVEGMASCPRCSQRGQGNAAFFNTVWLILRYQWGASVCIISVNGMAVMCNLGNL